MKNSLLKIIMVLISSVLILFLSLGVIANANESNEKIILKKSDTEYIVYYKDICEKQFQFAISKNNEETKDNLVFINSAKDKNTEKALNIVHIYDALFSQIFVDGENISTDAYIWIKDEEDNIIVEADKIDLSTAITDEQLDLVDSTTKRINVDTTKKHETYQVIDGVETTVTVGKVVVNEKNNSKYYYNLIKADESNPKEKELFELAETIQKGTDNTYESLAQSKRFYELYNKLMPKEDEWNEVENSEVLQPDTTRDGDKYIVWLKESNDTGDIIDAKFLISIYEYTPKYERGDKIIEKIVKSPITYDNPALIIIFVSVVAAIILLIILKAKTTKKSKK